MGGDDGRASEGADRASSKSTSSHRLTRRGLITLAGATTAAAWVAGCTDREEAPPAPLLSHAIVGNPTPDGFVVSTMTPGASHVRLKVGSNAAITRNVAYSAASNPDSDGWAQTTMSALAPGEKYHYTVEVTDAAGTRLSDRTGRAQTLPAPGEPASFEFAFGSCMATGVKDPAVMRRILGRDPLLFLHLGDFGYFDDTSSDAASHRENWERQMRSNSKLAQVLAEIPSYYIPSDHDAGGGNNAGPGPWTSANRAAYRQIFPHPDLGDHEEGLYWSVVVGRVRLIFTDHITFSSPPRMGDSASKTMMGETQKQWFKSEMQRSEPVKIWVQHSGFIGGVAEDGGWAPYSAERTELAEFISGQAVGETVTVHGDMHAVAVSRDNPWGLRSWCGGPFHQQSSHKGGPWTSGPYPAPNEDSTRQYGYVTVEDTRGRIDVAFNGCDAKDAVQVSDRFSVRLAS